MATEFVDLEKYKISRYDEDIIYEKKVSYKEFIKSIKEVSLI